MMFDAVPADTPELLEAAFRLRYQVYCLERGFEDPAANPGGLEMDRHDPHSRHAVLLDRVTGFPIGTIRVVFPSLGPVCGRLPLFDVFPPALSRLPAECTAELSRFAVSKTFRLLAEAAVMSRSRDEHVAPKDSDAMVASITLGLMGSALAMARQQGINYVCAIMEPALLRLLRRFGLRFLPIGPIIDHHGWRQPCYAALDELVDNLRCERPDVWQVIMDHAGSWGSGTLMS